MSKIESDYLRIENEFKEFKIPTSSEEMIYRTKQSQYKCLNKNKIKCTLCNKNLKQILITKDKCAFKSHPLLDVLLCSKCFYSYLNKPVRLDILGNVKNCAWCLGLSKLVTCASCFGRFCKKCIRRNFSDIYLKEINYSNWTCYACNSRPLWNYRFINYFVGKFTAENMDTILSKNVECSNKLSELQYIVAKGFLNKYVISIGCLSKMMLIRIKQISNEHFTRSSLETNDNVACCFNKLTIFHMQALENFDHINKTLSNDFSEFQREHFTLVNTTNETNSDHKDDKDLHCLERKGESYNALLEPLNITIPLEENLSSQCLSDIIEQNLDNISNQQMSDEINDYNNENLSTLDHFKIDSDEIKNDEPIKDLRIKRKLNDNGSNVNKSLKQAHFLMNLDLQTQKNNISDSMLNINEVQFPTEAYSESSIELNKLNENNVRIFSQSTEKLYDLKDENINKTEVKSIDDHNFKEDIDTLDVATELDIINSESDEEYKRKCKLAIEQILSDSLSSSDSDVENVDYANGKIVNIVDIYNNECELNNQTNVKNGNKKLHSDDKEVSKLVQLTTLNKNRKRLCTEYSSDDENMIDKKSNKRKKIKSSELESSAKFTSDDESDTDTCPIPEEIQNENINDCSVVLNYLDISSSDNENSQECIKGYTKNSNEDHENNNDSSSSKTDIYFSSEEDVKVNRKKSNYKENGEENIYGTSVKDTTKASWRNDSLLHGHLNFIDNESRKIDQRSEVFNVKDESDDSIVFFENEKIDDVISKSTTIPPERKKRKIISPEIICSDEDNKDESDDDVIEIDQLQTINDSLGKGRKNIRRVISDDHLLESTKKANKEEQERIRRLDDIHSNYHEIETEHLSERQLSNKNNIVLEYDLETKKPLIEIHPTLCNILKEHQVEGIKFMWDSCIESISKVTKDEKGTGCIVAHCMGLGKTLQVITLIHTLLSYPVTKIKRVLVVAPSNTVINWKKEFNLWLIEISENVPVYTLLNNKETNQRASILQHWFKNGGVVILSYHLFCNLLELSTNNHSNAHKALFQRTLIDPGPDLVICDEGHMLKNSSTIKSKIVTKIRTGRKIMLTGTPMQNNLKEYYCMVNIVKPNLLGNYLEYNNRFVNPILNGQHRDSSEDDIKRMKKRSHVLHKILSGVVQRYEESVLHPFLPPLHHYIVFIRLSNVQNLLYKQYLNLINNSSTGRQKCNRQVLSDYNVMKNIWTHPRSILQAGKTNEKNLKKSKNTILPHIDNGEISFSKSDLQTNLTGISKDWWRAICSDSDLNNLEIGTKLEILFDIIKECEAVGDKIVVFSTSLNILDSVEYFIKKESVRLKNIWQSNVDYFKIIGSTPAEIRSQYIDMFNNENNKKIKLLLASTKACGQGVNMIGANRIVTLDTPWNPADDLQSLFRIYRFGQKKTCYVYSLVSMNTMEQKIYERSVTKQAVACRVVDEQQINRHYIKNDIEELYNYTDLSNFERPTPNLPADRILATMIQKHSNLIWSFHEHKKLLQNQEDEELDEEERKAAWEEFKMEEDKRFNPVPVTLPSTAFDTNVTTTLKSTISSISNNTVMGYSSQNYVQNPMSSAGPFLNTSNMPILILPHHQNNTSVLYDIVNGYDPAKRNVNNQTLRLMHDQQIPGPSRIKNMDNEL